MFPECIGKNTYKTILNTIFGADLYIFSMTIILVKKSKVDLTEDGIDGFQNRNCLNGMGDENLLEIAFKIIIEVLF